MANRFQAKVQISVADMRDSTGTALIQTESMGQGYTVPEALADALSSMIDPSIFSEIKAKLS